MFVSEDVPPPPIAIEPRLEAGSVLSSGMPVNEKPSSPSVDVIEVPENMLAKDEIPDVSQVARGDKSDR